MRLATVLAAATVLGLGIEVAYANDRVGTIQSVRADERTFTLSDGNVYILQANAPASAIETLKRMKPGQDAGRAGTGRTTTRRPRGGRGDRACRCTPEGRSPARSAGVPT